MNIAYFGYPTSIHDAKWIHHFAKAHQVIVICQAYSKGSCQIDPSIPIYPILPATFSSFAHTQNKKIFDNINAYLDRYKIDLVHTLYAFPNALWGLKLKVPHIITTRGSDLLIDYQGLLQPNGIKDRLTFGKLRKDFSKTFKKATFITSTSIKQVEVAKKICQNDTKVYLIRTGIQVKELAIRSNEYSKPENDTTLRVFNPRSMAPVYNHEFTLKSFKLLLAQYPKFQFELTLINDAPLSDYSKKIISMANSFGLSSSITWEDALSQDQMFDQYAKCDLVISVPHSDGTPNSCLEAMAMKTPVFMSPLDYDTTIFNKDTCKIIRPFTIEEMAKQVRLFGQNKQSTDIRSRIENAYSTVEKSANIHVSLKQIEKLYLNAIGE